jgi:hypothetical protein
LKRRAPIIALALVLPSLARGTGDGTFEAPERIATSQVAVSLATGRFCLDGTPGIAAVHGTNRISVFLPAPWREMASIIAGNGFYAIRSADLDGDGLDDLVLADTGSASYVSPSKGDGSFGNPSLLPAGRPARCLAIADWNGDGSPDIATGLWEEGAALIYAGNGDGSFRKLDDLRPPNNPRFHDMDCGDSNGDGRPDLIGGVNEQGIQVFHGLGDGKFEIRPASQALGAVVGIEVCDLAGDGDRDALALISYSSFVAGIGDGSGGFRKVLDVEGVTCLPTAADLDGDGRLDIISSLANMDVLEIRLGKDGGTFRDSIAFGGAPSMPSRLVARDMDLDGLADLVAADGRATSLFLIPGRRDGLLALAACLDGFGPAKGFAFADLDGDRVQDILVACLKPRIDVFISPGKAAPWAAPSFAIPTTNSFSSLEVHDLDGDRVLDLAGSNVVSGALITATLGADGKVREEKSLPAGNLPGRVAVGLIDGDDRIDLAVPCAGPNHIAVFLNEGAGSFAGARIVPTARRPIRTAVIDLDRDGRSDLAVLASAAVAVHWGKGGGEFEDAAIVFDGKGLRDFSAADLDGDGLTDLAACDSILRHVVVLAGKGERKFEAAWTFPLADVLSCITLADLDGKGGPDIIAAAQTTSSAFVFLNGGGGKFGGPASYGLGIAASSIGCEDLDGDRAVDIVAFTASTIAILHGRPAAEPTFRRGDADGGGKPDLSDAVLVLGSLFLGGGPLPCEDAADANDDGALDLADPIALLGHLFLGAGPLPAPGAGSCGLDATADGLAPCEFECR